MRVGSDEYFKSLGYTKKIVEWVIVYTNMTQSIRYTTKEEAEQVARTRKHVWAIERRDRWI